jgi:predicted small lipoprotein YifL
MLASLPFARALALGGLTILALSACGRRGALEPPPDPAAAQAQQGAPTAGAPAGALPSPVGTPKRSSKQGFTIPKEPFILDPLL